MSQSSWQSRLSAIDNRIAQKLVDNQITLAGLATDCLLIRRNENKMSDITSIELDNILVVNIVFPGLKDVPMKRFYNPNSQTFVSANDSVTQDTEPPKPIQIYAPVATQVNQGSIILKFFENPTGVDPWILPLEVKDVFGTFGARTIIWQKMNVAYYDNIFPDSLMSYCLTLATRRNILGW